jgi:hypothetical protein
MRAGAVKFLRQLHQIQAALALKGGFALVGFGVMFPAERYTKSI